MKIALFGASGNTGVQVLNQALEKGYEINAFVRDANKISVKNSKLNIFVGDVTDYGTFGDVFTNVDAVVVTLGGVVANGIKNIIDGMNNHAVKKIVLMSSYPMSGSEEGLNYLKSAGMDEVKINQMMSMINDKKEQEKMITTSGLDWVIVRPTFLNDDQKTGDYKVMENAEFTVKDVISRADVADFILKTLSTSEWSNKVISISS